MLRDSLADGESEADGEVDEEGDGVGDGEADGDVLALGEIDKLTDDDGDNEADGESDNEAEEDGLKDADGETEAETDDDGEREAEGLMEADGLVEADGEREGETDEDGDPSVYVITNSDLLLAALAKFQFMVASFPLPHVGWLFVRSDSKTKENLIVDPIAACTAAIPAALKFHSLYAPVVTADNATVSPQTVVSPTTLSKSAFASAVLAMSPFAIVNCWLPSDVVLEFAYTRSFTAVTVIAGSSELRSA